MIHFLQIQDPSRPFVLLAPRFRSLGLTLPKSVRILPDGVMFAPNDLVQVLPQLSVQQWLSACSRCFLGAPCRWTQRRVPAQQNVLEQAIQLMLPRGYRGGGVVVLRLARVVWSTQSFFTQRPTIDEPAKTTCDTEVLQAARLLGVAWPCTKTQLARAFAVAISAAHPDRGGTAERTIAVIRARATLQRKMGDTK